MSLFACSRLEHPLSEGKWSLIKVGVDPTTASVRAVLTAVVFVLFFSVTFVPLFQYSMMGVQHWSFELLWGLTCLFHIPDYCLQFSHIIPRLSGVHNIVKNPFLEDLQQKIGK